VPIIDQVVVINFMLRRVSRSGRQENSCGCCATKSRSNVSSWTRQIGDSTYDLKHSCSPQEKKMFNIINITKYVTCKKSRMSEDETPAEINILGTNAK
jgi:hypothetical protein